jgi:hypothetical protein
MVSAHWLAGSQCWDNIRINPVLVWCVCVCVCVCVCGASRVLVSIRSSTAYRLAGSLSVPSAEVKADRAPKKEGLDRGN